MSEAFSNMTCIMNKRFFISLIFSFFISLVAFGQQDIEIKLFPERIVVSQSEPVLECMVLVRNHSVNNIAMRSSELVDVGTDSSYCWNLNVFHDGKRRYVYMHAVPYWKDLQKYTVLKQFQTRCFSFEIHFNKLNDINVSDSVDLEHEKTIKEILYEENNDFGEYEISIDYFDNLKKRNNAINGKVASNILRIRYNND